jgi:DNA-directed RNA polymerase subunit H (RpoH/RPB5)
MEDTALQTLRAMFSNPIATRGLDHHTFGFGRGLTGEFESLGSPLDETRMYVFAGILVIFSTKTRVTETEFNNFLKFAEENGYANGILIASPSNASDRVLGILRDYVSNRENPLVQIVEIRQLQFDKSRHRMVSPHRIITTAEADAMMKEFNVEALTQLPKIDCQDAMAAWIGARPGDVVEISGLCESSADNLRWRYCVADVTNG